MVPFLRLVTLSHILNGSSNKNGNLITVVTFTVLVVWSRGIAPVTRTHVGAFQVGASTICADLWFQALIHILKNVA